MTLVPTHIVFHGLSSSEALDKDIRRRVAWLERFYARIVGCRVWVEVPHRHHRSGRNVRVHVEVTVPRGEPIVVGHEHPDAAVAVHEAFDTARRRLQEFAREQRGEVKVHHSPAQP